MDVDKQTKQLLGAIFAGLLFIAGAIIWTGSIIATAINEEVAVPTKWSGPAFLVFGIIVLILSMGRHRS